MDKLQRDALSLTQVEIERSKQFDKNTERQIVKEQLNVVAEECLSAFGAFVVPDRRLELIEEAREIYADEVLGQTDDEAQTIIDNKHLSLTHIAMLCADNDPYMDQFSPALQKEILTNYIGRYINTQLNRLAPTLDQTEVAVNDIDEAQDQAQKGIELLAKLNEIGVVLKDSDIKKIKQNYDLLDLSSWSMYELAQRDLSIATDMPSAY